MRLNHSTSLVRIFHYCSLLIFLSACGGITPTPDPTNPAEELRKEIKQQLSLVKGNSNQLDDSTRLLTPEEIRKFYSTEGFGAVWSTGDTNTSASDSLLTFIRESRAYGLYPSSYHLRELEQFQSQFVLDTLAAGIRKDYKAIARRDLLLTDAFLTMARRIHRGHISMDSLLKDESYGPDIYVKALKEVVKSNNLVAVLSTLEPKHPGYKKLKEALPSFLSLADFSRQFTYIEFPYRDSTNFIRTLMRRLKEENYLDSSVTSLDTTQLATLLRKVQTERGLKVDGKYGPQLINALNKTDQEIFLKAAVNLDRYRMKSDALESRYLFVNLPAYELEVIDQDTVALESRVIIGKPKTPTPLISSRMNQIIVFPTWTIPASIIAHEILPAIKRDPGYLGRKKYNLYDLSGNEIDPYSVDWTKYSSGIPYKVVQGEGLGNALGVMKFNFPNEYYVYLHDTNQRSLFGNDYRSLSHGCVRVQNWEGLYKYVLRADSIQAIKQAEKYTSIDSVHRWLSEHKRTVIPLKTQLPIYFRYYTAAGKKGKLEVYNDVYNYDRPFREQILNSLR